MKNIRIRNLMNSLLVLFAVGFLSSVSFAAESYPWDRPHSQEYSTALEQIKTEFETNVLPLLRQRRCTDCHDSSVPAPFYAKLPFIGEMIKSDLRLGRNKLDVNDKFPLVTHYSAGDQGFLYALRTALKDRSMPPTQFLFNPMNWWGTTLSATEKQNLIQWTEASIEKLEAIESQEYANESQEFQAFRIMRERCARCHNPNLDRTQNKGFQSAGDYQELVNDADYVDTEEAKDGEVYKKIKKAKMPPSPNEALSEKETETLLKWLESLQE